MTTPASPVVEQVRRAVEDELRAGFPHILRDAPVATIAERASDAAIRALLDDLLRPSGNAGLIPAGYLRAIREELGDATS